MTEMRQRLLAGILLLAAAALSMAVTLRLGQLGHVPDRVMPYVLAYGAVCVVAAVAGRLLPPDRPDSSSDRPEEPPRRPSTQRVRWPAAALALVCFSWTWALQRLPEPPLTAFLPWVLSLVAVVFAFPDGTRRAFRRGFRQMGAGVISAIVVLLFLAACARFLALDRVLPVFGGDEAMVTKNGMEVLKRTWRSDPFGTGIMSVNHLATLPAGAGALLFRNPIAGPRTLPALIGMLSIIAAGALAGLLAGPRSVPVALALLAFAPHHVHFSRSAAEFILDAFLVVVGVFFLIAVRRSGSPRLGCLAGVCAGLALYSYGGGRVLSVVLFLCLPFLVSTVALSRGRRALVLAAVLSGYLAAGAPSLRFAARHFPEWNGRFHQSSIFAREWYGQEVKLRGSSWRVLANQIRLGTIGLLSSPPTIDIFTGYPMIAPFPLPALGIVGLAWLAGRRRIYEATVLGLVVAGNLAGVSLTLSTPQPQRASSLVPVLAVLGGVAVAGFLSLLPERGAGRLPWRTAAATLIVGALISGTATGYPLDWEPYAEGGGLHAAFAQSASLFLSAPRYRNEAIYFHGDPYVYWDAPSFGYFLPNRRAANVSDGNPTAFPAGLHVCSEEYLERAQQWIRRLKLQRGVRLPHPAYPVQDVGFVFLVAPERPRGNSPSN